MLAVSLGDHWSKTDEQTLAAAEPLARMLSKLPVKTGHIINDAVDPILFLYAMIALSAPSIEIEINKRKVKNANTIPNNKNGQNGVNGTGKPDDGTDFLKRAYRDFAGS
jgi:hypothetical protein